MSFLYIPPYMEWIAIVASGASGPNQLNGPISSGTNITIPPNSVTSATQYYKAGLKNLEMSLNGMMLQQGVDYTENGSTGVASNTIQMQINLVVGDSISFRIFGAGE